LDSFAKRVVLSWIAIDVIWCSLLVWALERQQA
jgi:hypothetical protein